MLFINTRSEKITNTLQFLFCPIDLVWSDSCLALARIKKCKNQTYLCGNFHNFHVEVQVNVTFCKDAHVKYIFSNQSLHDVFHLWSVVGLH